MADHGPTVDQLITIWQELLDTTTVDPDDDFYDLGGHSLFVLQLLSRVARDCGVQITLDDVFTFRTPTTLGQRIDTLRRPCVHQA